ncbi:hypothetical protein [Nitrobacter winogradskyi]|uniref:hypothetical protein n=1 Tax=Nitrobacter winogradskyi TaxID=913 RepID=UPI0002DDD3E4|nr:hypothetical protein [Nitrobacter winogradskyi]
MERIKPIFCQIDTIGSTVSAPHNEYSIGEMKMVANALRKAEEAIETEIRWRVSNNLDMGGAA